MGALSKYFYVDILPVAVVLATDQTIQPGRTAELAETCYGISGERGEMISRAG
jgi:hypothetical protein